MPIPARNFVRRMRGGAQAHLLECGDGHHYVVKFRNNPQHRRILVNEWIGAAVFRYLRLLTPPTAIVEVTASWIAEQTEIGLQMGTRIVAPEPGWHFGSRFPGHPDRLAVYDFLPDQILDKLHNRAHFVGALVADKWLGNADARQAVFFRANVREHGGEQTHPLQKAFLAQMIDHGFVANGPHWDFPDVPVQGLYSRHHVYAEIRGWEQLEPWLSQVESFPSEVLDQAWRSMPPQWLEGEEEEFARLMEALLKRRSRIRKLLDSARESRVNPFQNWA